MSNKRRICVVLVDRANYGRLRPVMQAVSLRQELELQIVVAGTMVLERFGAPSEVVREDGFTISGEVHMELEGSRPVTMAKSIGLGIVEFAGQFESLRPDVVLLIGDRYESLAAAISAAYMNLCIAHIQGGEVSGSIDESCRHAITKFAHYHFPSTRRAADYVIRMGEDPETVLAIGCPSSDIAATLTRSMSPRQLNTQGSGAHVDLSRPYLLSVFHPTTTEYGGENDRMLALLTALRELSMPTVLLWPNIDAGSNRLNKVIRAFLGQHNPDWLRVIINLPPIEYLLVLRDAACAIGNSSSFVRDASFLGTPVVLVGGRQQGRESDANVERVSANTSEIVHAARRQLTHGRYPKSDLYGDGAVSDRIAAALTRLNPYVQKRLHYPDVAAAWSKQRVG